jgi:hypothetical protein
MRLLDRYLLRELLIPLGYCLSGFFIFWVSSDLFAELRSLQERKLQLSDIAEYYLVKSPEFVVVVLPVALLLALLYSLTNHARHHEITAIRAAGISIWRLALPYFGVGLVSSLALLALNEVWVPDSSDRAEQIKGPDSQVGIYQLARGAALADPGLQRGKRGNDQPAGALGAARRFAAVDSGGTRLVDKRGMGFCPGSTGPRAGSDQRIAGAGAADQRDGLSGVFRNAGADSE